MKSIVGSLIFLSIAYPFEIYSQKHKVFKWSDDCCEYEGTYDPSKVSEEQLRNTFQLFFWGYSIEARQSVFKLSDVSKLNYDSLVNEYARKTLQVSKLDVIDNDYWKGYRKDVVNELNQVFYRKKITLLAHSDPGILSTYSFKDSCSSKYGNAIIAGGDSLLVAWKDLLEEQCKVNADPDRLRREFDVKYNSPDRLKYALIELLTFGWWNCVNSSIEYTYLKREDAYAKFKKEFTHVKELGCGCD